MDIKKIYVNSCIVIAFFLLFTTIIPSEEALSREIQLKDKVVLGPYEGEYKTFEEALRAVSDGGTIEIKCTLSGEPYTFSEVVIDKNVYIAGIKNGLGQYPIFSYYNYDNSPPPFITATTSNFLSISNIEFSSNHSSSIFIESYIPSLVLDNVSVINAYPVKVKTPLENDTININIINCSFSSKAPELSFDTPTDGYINFSNNVFEGGSFRIKNMGAQIDISNNIFSKTNLDISEGSYGTIDVHKNRIINNSVMASRINSFSSKDVSIRENSFEARSTVVTNNDAENELDMKYNWWGSASNPADNSNVRFNGSINYGNWALDEDFSQFYDDSLSNVSIQGNATLHNCVNYSGVKVDLKLENAVLDAVYTDEYGYFNFNDLEPNVYTLTFEYEGFVSDTLEIDALGAEAGEINIALVYERDYLDVDGDGVVDDFDLVRIANYFGQDSSEEGWEDNFDLNRDGKVDVLDLIMVLRYEAMK